MPARLLRPRPLLPLGGRPVGVCVPPWVERSRVRACFTVCRGSKAGRRVPECLHISRSLHTDWVPVLPGMARERLRASCGSARFPAFGRRLLRWHRRRWLTGPGVCAAVLRPWRVHRRAVRVRQRLWRRRLLGAAVRQWLLGPRRLPRGRLRLRGGMGGRRLRPCVTAVPTQLRGAWPVRWRQPPVHMRRLLGRVRLCD